MAKAESKEAHTQKKETANIASRINSTMASTYKIVNNYNKAHDEKQRTMEAAKR